MPALFHHGAFDGNIVRTSRADKGSGAEETP